jgi:hypothetical protein
MIEVKAKRAMCAADLGSFAAGQTFGAEPARAAELIKLGLVERVTPAQDEAAPVAKPRKVRKSAEAAAAATEPAAE